MTEKELQTIIEKAAKWDALYEKISVCYAEEGEDDFDEYEVEADLVTIGEIAATAFGFL